MKLLLLILTTLSLSSQTRPTIDQLKGPPGEVRLLALDATGKLMTLNTGEGIEIANGVIKMKAVPVPEGYRVFRSQWTLSRMEDGTYVIASGDTIYRGGMLMSPGIDYTISAGRVRPVEPWPAEQIVTAVAYRILPVSPAVSPVTP